MGLKELFGMGGAGKEVPSHGPAHPLHPGWPEVTPTVRLASTGSSVRLRPIARGDGMDWRQTRLLDESHLRPVEPTVPAGWEASHTPGAWWQHYRYLRGAAQVGDIVPLVIEVDGQFAGQLTLGNIQHGALQDCWIGYWVFSAFAGAGVATAACALGVDHAFARVGLHRVTATFMPDNRASGVVLRHCGFREEGMLRRNLHIDGRWRDHVFVALTVEDYPNTAVDRLRAAGRLL